MFGHVEVDDAPAMVSEHDEDESTRMPAVGTVKEVERNEIADMVGEEVRHVCDGGERRLGMSRETVLPSTLRPSFISSPWSRGAPQSGLALAIRVIKALSSVSTLGRPPVGRAESLVQYSRKRRSCHRKTVSGDTMMRACLQPAQTVARPTHNRRSVGHSFGPGTVRLYTASCWRRARFSRASWRWPPTRKGRSRRRWSRRVIIERGLSPDRN
jgi:hypothetical protein